MPAKLDLKASLQRIVKSNPPRRSQTEIDKETDELFVKYMEGFAAERRKEDPSYEKVPRFFDAEALKKDVKSIYNAVQKEARSRFLHHKTTEILDKEDVEKLWETLRANTSAPDDGNERVNYDAFLKVANALPSKCRQFFSASTFLKFDRDEYGRIDSLSFFHSVVRKVSLFQTRIQISLYDRYGNGYLSEQDLQNFISEQMPNFPNLSGMSEELKPKYLMVAARKFFFFLDPRKLGRVFIKDILTSPILGEFFDLRNEKSSDEFLNNWFSLQNTARIVELFKKLDENGNGTLDAAELGKFQWSLTELFLRRALEQLCSARTGFEMEFQAFVEFILIIENKKNNQSIQFIFRCIDIFDHRYIDSFIVNFFFKEVLIKLASKDAEAEKNFRVEDVKDEIFDMTNPKNPKFLTLYDLYECGQADVILGILIDAKIFFDYDQRELNNTLNIDDDAHFEFSQNEKSSKEPILAELMDASPAINPPVEQKPPVEPARRNYGKFAEV